MSANDNEMNNIKRIFITPLRIEDEQSNGSNPVISAPFRGILNEKWCKDVNGSNESNNIVNELKNENENGRKIVINELTNGSKQIKKKEKEKKMRVETKTWGLGNDELSFETQLQLLNTIFNKNDKKRDKHIAMIVSHIKAKICSYKQQDILKGKLLETEFVSFTDVIDLLNESKMRCHYCACETYLLYEIVRENKQWSLDRINNEIGHNRNNLLIACLECNLKRRRTNKDAFFFTKNLQIVRLD
jgi:hypothetical protein